MPPPLAPSQLAAQKYNEVQNYDELIAAGVGEHIPIMTLLVNGEKPGFGDEQTLAWVHQDLSNKICDEAKVMYPEVFKKPDGPQETTDGPTAE